MEEVLIEHQRRTMPKPTAAPKLPPVAQLRAYGVRSARVVARAAQLRIRSGNHNMCRVRLG